MWRTSSPCLAQGRRSTQERLKQLGISKGKFNKLKSLPGSAQLWEERPNIPGVLNVNAPAAKGPSGDLPPNSPFGISSEYSASNELKRQKQISLEKRGAVPSSLSSSSTAATKGASSSFAPHPFAFASPPPLPTDDGAVGENASGFVPTTSGADSLLTFFDEPSLDPVGPSRQLLEDPVQRAIAEREWELASGKDHTTLGYRETARTAPVEESGGDAMGLLFQDEISPAIPSTLTGVALDESKPARVFTGDSLGTTTTAGPGANLAEIKIGSVQLDVKSLTDFDGTGVPLQALRDARGPLERDRQSRVPHHIGKLFHKIMGWSSQLAQSELDNTTGLTREGTDPKATKLEPAKRAEALQNKMKYGVLLDDMEDDRFALEQKIEVAGLDFERKWTDWEALNVHDKTPEESLRDIKETKNGMVLRQGTKHRTPTMGRDPCPGCGATFQDQDENQYGFTTGQRVGKWLSWDQSQLELRSQYADRMAELQKHWEVHGKRVGEEWLDFMTDHEFRSIYEWKPKPHVCTRCAEIRTFGTDEPDSVLPAEDFSDQLTALKKQKCVVVLVIDLFDFPGSMVMDLPGLLSMNNQVIIAANKLDLIQEANFGYTGKWANVKKRLLSRGRLRQWITEIATQYGLPAHRIADVIPVSSRVGWNVHDLIESIEKHSNLNLTDRSKKPIPTYFVGVTNVGKSSLLNRISQFISPEEPPNPHAVKQYYTETNAETGVETLRHRWYIPKHEATIEDEASVAPKKSQRKLARTLNHNLTTSNLPGTTVATRAIKVSSNNREQQSFLFDTPGLYPHWVESTTLSIGDQMSCLPRRYRNFNGHFVLTGNTLLFGGIAAVEVVSAPESGLYFCCYSSNRVHQYVVQTDRADEFWDENVGVKLTPPRSEVALGKKRLSVKKTYLFECYNNQLKRPVADIYFCGLGWVSFHCSAQHDVVLKVRTVPGVVHGVRDPLRYKDMSVYSPWPRAKRTMESRMPHDVTERVTKVVQLTAGPYDESEAPEQPVPNPFSQEKEDPGGFIHTLPPKKSMSLDERQEALKQKKQKKGQSGGEDFSEQQPSAGGAFTSDPFDDIMSTLRRQGKI